jgi:hypothetical protein
MVVRVQWFMDIIGPDDGGPGSMVHGHHRALRRVGCGPVA